MSELLIARKINSLNEVVKASRIGKKKKFHNLIRTDMNDMINERDKEFANEFSRFVNGKMCSASKVGAEFANDHRWQRKTKNSQTRKNARRLCTIRLNSCLLSRNHCRPSYKRLPRWML